MKKENWFRIMKISGLMIMLLAFPIVPEEYPWYYQVLLFDIGLVLFLATKWSKLKQEIGITNS